MIKSLIKHFNKSNFLIIVLQKFYYILFFNNKNLNRYRKILKYSKNDINLIQRNKLKTVLYEAVNFVPFYKSLDLDIDFENFTLEELNKFPIIDKKIIQEKPKLFLSSRRYGIYNSTSGSSGTPFKFKIGFSSLTKESLTFFRSLYNPNYTYEVGDPIIIVRSYVPKAGEPIIKCDIKNNHWYISPFHIGSDNIKLIIDFINKSKAKIMRGYPSSILILTAELEKVKKFKHNIKIISTSSEMLLPINRKRIETFWNLKVLDYYGQNENVISFSQCKNGNYHNNDDYGIVEIKDNFLIGTSLNNLVMPLIRYNTFDKTNRSFIDEKIECDCGNTFSIPLKSIDGRNDDILIKKDGTKVSTANFSTAFKNLNSIDQFQFIQFENKDITVKLKLNELNNNHIEEFRQNSIERLGEDISIKIEIVSQIKRDPITQKIKTTIQKAIL